jgi:tripartite-type tricarboxylate transporter receptor subunit TctC
MIVPFLPGADGHGRTHLGRAHEDFADLVVENVTGAGGTIGIGRFCACRS